MADYAQFSALITLSSEGLGAGWSSWPAESEALRRPCELAAGELAAGELAAGRSSWPAEPEAPRMPCGVVLEALSK